MPRFSFAGPDLNLQSLLLAALPTCCCASPLYAWKPVTHVYLAELALQDALDGDGKVTIYATDYQKGLVLKDALGNPIVVRRYKVDTDVLNAISNYPEQFRAAG